MKIRIDEHSLPTIKIMLDKSKCDLEELLARSLRLYLISLKHVQRGRNLVYVDENDNIVDRVIGIE